MTDEAREAFTAEKMPAGWPRENGATHNFKAWAPECRKAWLYDARIALERLGYKFMPNIAVHGANAYDCIFPETAKSYAHSGTYTTCELAIEAGVMDWYERREEQQ